MNAHRIVIHPIPYISLQVSASILGRTVEMKRLCAHVTHHCVQEPKVMAFPFAEDFSFTGRYRWEAAVLLTDRPLSVSNGRPQIFSDSSLPG